MEKVEKNKHELQKFIDQLKNKTEYDNGIIELFAKVNFTCEGISREDTVTVQLLSGHHAGKVQVVDENDVFNDVFVRFISNSQDYVCGSDGVLMITDTSGQSKLGNYEVRIEEM